MYLVAHCATAVTLVRFMIQAGEVSFLDFVRNKNRKALDLLANVTFVVHTLAPQK